MAQERSTSAPEARVLLHVARDRRRAVDPGDVYFLDAVGETTLVRLRSAGRSQRGEDFEADAPPSIQQ